jgi:lysozyme
METGHHHQTPSSAEAKTSGSERFRNIALGLAGIISSVLIPLIGFYYTSRDKEREVSKGFVEIATKILSDKPTDDNKPLREWAIALIDNYSAVRLPDDARSALLNSQQIFEGTSTPGSTSRARLQQLQHTGYTLGLTISQFDPPVDFSAVKQRGIQFAVIRVSQGTSRVDAKGIEYAKSAKRSGLKIGAYHFFTPNDDVGAQLTNFLAQLQSMQWDLPPTIDCEELPGATMPADYASRVDQFGAQLEQRLGIKPIIYTGFSFANRYLDQGASAFPLFIAQFGARPTPTIPKWWKDYAFWHVAEGVNDDPLLARYDVVAFKGKPEELAALNTKK